MVEERPLTIFLNAQEIVTAMTIGDYPEYLAVGYLLNQGMLRRDDRITGIDHDEELETVVVRTERATDYEEKLRKKTRTSGCAVGTVFGDVMEGLEGLRLPDAMVRSSELYALAQAINTTPSLYLEAGAIHGTVLCEGARPLVYMEDVGRHNAVDKIAGWMAMAGRRGGRQAPLHHRAADLGDGDQDGADGHPGARQPLRLHRLGGGDRPAGRADADRADARAALPLPRRRRAAGAGRRPRARSRRRRRGTAARRRRPTDRRPIAGRVALRRPAVQEGGRAKGGGMAGSGILGVILAGGRATRMGGGDKGLIALGGRPILGHVIDRLRPQVDGLALNANGDPARFAGLRAAGAAGQRRRPSRAARRGAGRARLGGGGGRRRPSSPPRPTRRSFPATSPHGWWRRPAAAGTPLAMAVTPGERGQDRHPTFGLWPVGLRDDLRAALGAGRAQGRGVDRAARLRQRGLSGRARRSSTSTRPRISPAPGRWPRRRGREALRRHRLEELGQDRCWWSGWSATSPPAASRSRRSSTPTTPSTSTSRARTATATAPPARRRCMVASSRRWALITELRGAPEPPLDALLARLDPVDLVLVEGYKRDRHPKIEARRAATAQELIAAGDASVEAVASDTPLPGLAVPVFDLDDVAAIAGFILARTGLA